MLYHRKTFYRRVMMIYAGAVVLAAATVATAQEGRPAYTPIAPEFGYFQENDLLKSTIAAGDMGPSREHAWRLFAGLQQPLDPSDDNSWPIWFSWQTSAQAFVKDGAPSKAVSSIRVSPQVAAGKQAQAAGVDIPVNTKGPSYPVPEIVKTTYPTAIKSDGSVADGAFFVNNGDIMIAVESLSAEGFAQIRDDRLYESDELKKILAAGDNVDLTDRYVSTKLMYWPVKASGFTPLPWWNFQYPDTYDDYFGYETWNTVVAIDPSGEYDGGWVSTEYLFGVMDNAGTSPIGPKYASAQIVGLDQFYHHQITQSDWDIFTDADKAILNQASQWLYNAPFEPGDYIAAVAMHINTKEVPTWTLQSFWWSNLPDTPPYAANRPQMNAVGPWQHYLLTEANAYEAGADGELPIAVNPYIEGVIHPIRTSCRNCHQRAGIPGGGGAGQTGYSNSQCPDLLAALTPESACFEGVSLSDFAWIIPDRAH